MLVGPADWPKPGWLNGGLQNKGRVEEAEMSFILPHAAAAVIHDFGREELSMFELAA